MSADQLPGSPFGPWMQAATKLVKRAVMTSEAYGPDDGFLPDMCDAYLSGPPLPFDDYKVLQVQTRGDYVPMTDKNGKPITDRAGVALHEWRDVETEEYTPRCALGSYFRAIAHGIGIERKALFAWTPADLEHIAIKALEMVDSGAGERGRRRAERFPDYPDGWRDAAKMTRAKIKELERETA